MNSKTAHLSKPCFRNLILPTVLFMASAWAIYAQNANVSIQSDLENAIEDANTGIVSTITFLNDIVLESALPDILNATVTIEGQDHTLSRDVTALTEFRILTVASGTVIINDLTISRGRAMTASWPSGFAGAVFSGGSLTMNNCTLSDNQAWNGGAVRTGAAASGFYNCTFINNTATENGGAAFVSAQTTFENCTISGNVAATGSGGGIHCDASLTLIGSTVSENSATYTGGGINASGTPSVTLTNCTISGNSCSSIGSWGGGINVGSQNSLTITNCTVTGNQSHEGAGVYGNYGASVMFVRSIIAGNTGSSTYGREITTLATGNAYNVFGHDGLSSSDAFNGFSPGVNDFVCTSNGNTPTPLASILNGALANNGGPTLTHALVAGSPAIDVAAEGPATDQRGYTRPYGAGFDAGAFEFGASPVTPPGPTPDPTPTALLEEHEHHLIANTISPIHCDLDPNDILGASPIHTISAGALPRHLSIEGQFLDGTFGAIGTYRFSVSSTGGINEVRNHFIIQVIPPTLTPFISGIRVNEDYKPTIVQQERTHGDAALTELLNIRVAAGSPLRLVFDWDYIKHSYSFKIIRGSLPAGLTLRETTVDGLPTAVIEGTPTTPGEHIFVVSVKDWRERAYQWIRLIVE